MVINDPYGVMIISGVVGNSVRCRTRFCIAVIILRDERRCSALGAEVYGDFLTVQSSFHLGSKNVCIKLGVMCGYVLEKCNPLATRKNSDRRFCHCSW